MDIIPEVVYRIDSKDRLAEVGEGWLSFATANRGLALQASHILGRPLWDFLADATTTQLYQAMVQRLRRGGPPVRFRFRCDAPCRRRLLAMEITGGPDGGVGFKVTSVLEQPRPSVSLLEPEVTRGAGLLAMCGWCKRSRLPTGGWVEVEEAIQRLGLFGGEAMPGVTHGICPPCYTTIAGVIDDRAADGGGTVTVGQIGSP